MLCYDCPRNCGINREKYRGFCGEGNKIRVAKIIEHFMWEEPCISGEKGALAIFFSGCNLRCEFCQNYDISHLGKGEYYTPKEFRDLLLSYDLSTFSCVDLITPSHFSSLLFDALSDFDCPIPIVWNSSGYEKEDMIDSLSRVVDVFMPDLKYVDEALSLNCAKAQDYFSIASKAILSMRKNKPKEVFKNGVLQEGVLIRHLVMPIHFKDSIKVLDFIKEKISNPFISLMSQFTPTQNSKIKRRLLPLEYKYVLIHAQNLGLTNGYFQELESANQLFIPQF